MWFWIIAGIFVVLLLFGAWLWDRWWTVDETRMPDHYPDGTLPYHQGDGGGL